MSGLQDVLQAYGRVEALDMMNQTQGRWKLV